MKPKQLYCYFFFILYKTWSNVDKAFGASGLFSTKSKALISMFAIEIWLVFSIALDIGYFFNFHPHIAFFSFTGIAPLVILFGIEWIIFDKDDQWKSYIHEFSSWPKEKNRLGTWIVLVVILFIILNFICSLYLNKPATPNLKW